MYSLYKREYELASVLFTVFNILPMGTTHPSSRVNHSFGSGVDRPNPLVLILPLGSLSALLSACLSSLQTPSETSDSESNASFLPVEA